jgi:peptidoglycan-N-acetylglucosamine deacetylase
VGRELTAACPGLAFETELMQPSCSRPAPSGGGRARTRTHRLLTAACLLAAGALVRAQGLPAPPDAAPCPPGALGTNRVLPLPREGAAYGREQHAPLPLAANEVVLTFDDGPAPETTPQVLQALKAECARATFFMNGDPVLANPALARQVQAEGHGVAMHGFRHVAFGSLPPRHQLEDLQALQKAMRRVLGSEPAAWRYPYLAASAVLDAELRRQGITVMSQDVGLTDWLPDQTPEILADRLLRGLQQRGGGIVLMHDTQVQTAAALPLLLRRLKADGWRLVHLQWPADAHPRPDRAP